MQHVPVHCFVCGSENDSEFLHVIRRATDGSEGSYRIAECNRCKFLYVNPRPTPDELVALYGRHAIYFREGYEPVSLELPVLKLVMKEIRRYVPGGSLLEVGCGRGELLELAQKQGYRVWGCDLQRSAALDSTIPFHVGVLRSAGFQEESFDCIVMRNTLEHLFDPREELKACRRLLKTDGYIYLKVPNADYEHGWRCRLMWMKPNVFGPPWHLNYFTPATLKRFLRSYGFELAEWLIERPTTNPSRLRDAIQRSSAAGFRLTRALSFGTVFPKPLLTCLARRVSPS